jgi:hypothetical protein
MAGTHRLGSTGALAGTPSKRVRERSVQRHRRYAPRFRTPTLRVWHLRVPVGGRFPFHRHVNDYFWTAHTAGRARTYYHDGRIVEDRHHVGETKHLHFGPGEFFVHSLENIGETDLLFTTVEFLNGANEALPVPDSARLKAPKLAA